jgi:plastocyanin
MRNVLVLLALLAAGPAAAETVTISNFVFDGRDITVAPGSEVTWVNNDDDPHIIAMQGASPLFRSPALDKGERYTFVFKNPGTYKYFCTLHPHMVGTVTVVAR